jgi:hypothetical protein
MIPDLNTIEILSYIYMVLAIFYYGINLYDRLKRQ